MTEERLPSKFAFILHADVAGSTELVRQDEHVAHKRIQDTFRRLGEIITKYHGYVRELRGDALLAEFERASDAVTAALAFQADQFDYNTQLEDSIRPTVRVGIAMGEVIIADDTVTGEGVVLAQRVEQLIEPGGVCITGAIHEALPQRLPFDQDDLGEQEVKGFDEPVRVYAVWLKEGATLPDPIIESVAKKTPIAQWIMVAAVVVLICGGGLLAWVQPWKPDFEPASVEKMAFPLPDKPSIAVLPFDNYLDDEQLKFFADGLTENIISALSKVQGLLVIARNSAATYKDKPVNVKQVAEELGVQYVLEGSVQTSGDQLRITAKLVDAIKGHHLWSDRFDRQAGNVFAVQDEITKRVFTELQVELTEGEHARMAAGGTDNLEAWLRRIEGYNELIKFTRESQIRARELYQAAHEADPNWAFPVAGFSFTHWYEARRGWSESREESIRLGIEAAERAIELQPNEAIGYTALSNMMFMINENKKGMEFGRKAVELAPNSFAIVATLAIRLSEADQEHEAVELFERAVRLSPKYPWWIDFGYGFALHMMGRKEEAVDIYKKGIDKGAQHAPIRVRLAAVYVDLGQMDEARAAIDDALQINPQFTATKYRKSYPYPGGQRYDWYHELVTRAGLPEYPPLTLPDKPSIAVLPFDAYSDESEQKHFANGLTEDLITTLSRVPDLFVIARTSTQKYKGKQVDVREVAKELGVGYILEGSIQKSGNNMRINAQLIDGANGNHVWAKKYDRPATDFFAIQDDIVRRILVEMQVKLTVGDNAKVASRGTENLDAYLLGRQAASEGFTFTPEGMVRARQLYQEAHETDPEWSRPLAGVAWTHYEEARRGWSKSREDSTEQGISLAKQAIEMDPEDPFGYMQLGNLMILLGDWDQGIALREKAIGLAPNDFFALVGLAYLLIWSDDAERALEIYQRARKVSPIVPWWMLASESLALHLNDQHEQAVNRLEESMERNPKHSMLHVRLAAIYSDLGRDEEAKKQMGVYLNAKSNATIATTMKSHTFKDKARAEWYADLLRKAGMPE